MGVRRSVRGAVGALLFTLAAVLVAPEIDASRALTSGAANASAHSYLETRIGVSEIEGRDLVGALGALSAEERPGYAASSGETAAGEHHRVLVHNARAGVVAKVARAIGKGLGLVDEGAEAANAAARAARVAGGLRRAKAISSARAAWKEAYRAQRLMRSKAVVKVGRDLTDGTLNPRLATRLEGWRAFKARGGENMAGWVKATKRQYGDPSGFHSGFTKYIRQSENALGGAVQKHHLVSRRMATALERRGLPGSALRRRPDLLYRSAPGMHYGYEDWHIAVDREIVRHLRTTPGITEQSFLRYLHDVYQRPGLARRIPGVRVRY